MTLPASGPISASNINLELRRASNATFNINGSLERALAGVLSGAISLSNFYGKTYPTSVSLNLTIGAVNISGTFHYGYFTSPPIGVISPGTLLSGNIVQMTANSSNVIKIGVENISAVISTFTKFNCGDGVVRTLNWNSVDTSTAALFTAGDANSIAIYNFYSSNVGQVKTITFSN